MFAIIPCAAGCGRAAITGSRICAVHAANPALESERIAEYIAQRLVIKDLNAPGLHFDSIDFSRRQF
ncbi:MAG: pentapeptide repeat-containing protein, partial [Treponema sp.]|nr:pentapeptide repeat-containing protein [Treponema sp.]